MDRVHRVVLGTRMWALDQVPRRILDGYTRMQTQLHLPRRVIPTIGFDRIPIESIRFDWNFYNTDEIVYDIQIHSIGHDRILLSESNSN